MSLQTALKTSLPWPRLGRWLPAGETCVCDLTGPVGLSQPTVSHHMKVLVDTGLLSREQRGKLGYYRLVPGALESLTQALAGAAAAERCPLARAGAKEAVPGPPSRAGRRAADMWPRPRRSGSRSRTGPAPVASSPPGVVVTLGAVARRRDA